MKITQDLRNGFVSIRDSRSEKLQDFATRLKELILTDKNYHKWSEYDCWATEIHNKKLNEVFKEAKRLLIPIFVAKNYVMEDDIQGNAERRGWATSTFNEYFTSASVGLRYGIPTDYMDMNATLKRAAFTHVRNAMVSDPGTYQTKILRACVIVSEKASEEEALANKKIKLIQRREHNQAITASDVFAITWKRYLSDEEKVEEMLKQIKDLTNYLPAQETIGNMDPNHPYVIEWRNMHSRLTELFNKVSKNRRKQSRKKVAAV